MQCSFSPLAANDLENIGDYIASNNPVRAITFIREIRVKCGKLAEIPKAHPLRPELGVNIRMAPFKAYLIFYKENDSGIRIERILHGSRDYLPLLKAFEN